MTLDRPLQPFTTGYKNDTKLGQTQDIPKSPDKEQLKELKCGSHEVSTNDTDTKRQISRLINQILYYVSC